MPNVRRTAEDARSI